VRLGTGVVAAGAGALLALGLWLWLSNPRGPGALPTPPEADPATQRALAQTMAARVVERVGERGADAAAPTRSPVEPQPDLAALPTVKVRLRDAHSGEPVAAACAFDAQGTRALGVADAAGELALPLLPGGRVMFVADGYFTKLVQPGDDDAAALQAGVTKPTSVAVDLLRDDYTLPVTLQFVDGGGAAPTSAVRFVIRCLDEVPPTAGSFPRARLPQGAKIEREVAEAWQRHVLLAQVLPSELANLHLGALGQGQSFTALGSTRLRFVDSGTYRVEAIAPEASLAGSLDFRVAQGNAGPIVVQLTPGRFLRGIVLDANSQAPIAGALVRVAVEGLALPPAETSAAGTFALGPVALPSAPVRVTSRRHLDLEASVAVGTEQRLLLTPRPTRAVQGVVRLRPTLQPIAGAEVALREAGVVDVAAKTGADGGFRLVTVAAAPELLVRAPGCLTWLEAIHDPVDSYVCDLWPADASARVAAGLTAVVEGRVQASDGKPVAGIPVQLFTDDLQMPEGIAGRAVLEGHLLPLRPLVITGDDGAFTLEWGRGGPVRLVVTDGVTTAADGVPITLVLGQHTRDIVLRR
jgi:hypothetical protein